MVLASWAITIPLQILAAILGLLPDVASKPIYDLGDRLLKAMPEMPAALKPVVGLIDGLRSDRYYRFWAINLLAVVGVAIAGVYLYNQVTGIVEETNFEVITQPFNASLDSGFLSTEGSDPIWLALLKGLVNTLILVILSIALASLIGLVVGVARLAKHPIISRFAAGYTELFRNVPLLALMLLLSAAVFLQVLPIIANAWTIPRVFYLSNRGLAIPSIAAGHDLWWIWVIFLVLGVAAALYLRRRLILKEDETGGVYRPNLYSFLLFIGIAGLSYLILFFAFGLNVPTTISFPGIDDSRIVLRYQGGFILSTAFLAALMGLIFYFSAFIAEIVRGSIQAISHGQTEAANALGLSAYQRLTLVILPQAFTIMIPSLNNEYQNVNKDSAVAFGIGYVELLFVLRQVANERGELVTILIAGLLVYMFVNLIISAVMNTLNRLNQVAR